VAALGFDVPDDAVPKGVNEMPYCGVWETASGGFWWILPVLGLVVMVVMAFACFRGFGCMGWRAGRGDVSELRRELQELREDVQKVLRPS
jgi:uncharacterized membrane protein